MAFLEALPLTCLVIAIVAILRWLLTAPYRGVGAQYYAKGTSRRFLLTGCASGMGRHLTGVLLKLGHRVAATDVNETGLRAAAAAETCSRCGSCPWRTPPPDETPPAAEPL